jgi:hypothetical protein
MKIFRIIGLVINAVAFGHAVAMHANKWMAVLGVFLLLQVLNCIRKDA